MRAQTGLACWACGRCRPTALLTQPSPHSAPPPLPRAVAHPGRHRRPGPWAPAAPGPRVQRGAGGAAHCAARGAAAGRAGAVLCCLGGAQRSRLLCWQGGRRASYAALVGHARARTHAPTHLPAHLPAPPQAPAPLTPPVSGPGGADATTPTILSRGSIVVRAINIGREPSRVSSNPQVRTLLACA